MADHVAHHLRNESDLEHQRRLAADVVPTERTMPTNCEDQAKYDDLSEEEQAVVRVAWEHRAEELRQQLDFSAEFTAARESYSELDVDGCVVTINPPH